MKRGIAAVLLFLFAAGASGQDEETLLTGRLVHGGFGGPVVKFTRLRGEFGVLVGGRGGWVINHCFSIGGGGYGLVNAVSGPEGIPLRVDPVLTAGYGGFEMEYIHHSGRLMHSSVQLLIGGGGVGIYERRRGEDWNDE
jgi:hypothetical protein